MFIIQQTNFVGGTFYEKNIICYRFLLRSQREAYYEEHLFLTGQLRKDFDLVICNPKDMNKFTEDFDLTIFRNAGPIANFKEEYDLFRQNISSKKTKYIQLFQWER